MKELSDGQLAEVLSKMFEMVGDTYTPEKTTGEEWYLAHSWTMEKDEEFIHWLTRYLKRKRICGGDSARKDAEMFAFQYGWKIEA